MNQKIKKGQVLITGSSGSLGRALSRFLREKGYQVVGLSRNTKSKAPATGSQETLVRWNPEKLDGWEKVLEKTENVINLAGSSIGARPWTKRYRELILNSRIQSSQTLVEAFLKTVNKPLTFIQISGIGYYGSRGEEPINENSAGGQGFLATVSREWEDSTAELEKSGIRRIICRTSIVLGPDGGALSRLLLPFRFFLGSRFGSGRQWVPWIHLLDTCRAMEFLISQPQLGGIFNLSAPQPLTNREWTGTIAAVLGKPAFLKIPAWLIRIFLGEMGEELLLSSQRVIPQKLLDNGFEFKFPDLASSLMDIIT